MTGGIFVPDHNAQHISGVPMPLPRISNSAFSAYIADNHAAGVHRKGYNGVVSLIPHDYGNNIFVPDFAGLNYETISLAGLPNYQETHPSKFDPRAEPMNIVEADESRVILEQPPTSHAHVSARISFTISEPWYLDQHIELTFHKRFCDTGEPNRFSSLWASYIHQPRDRYIYLQRPDARGPFDNWVGLTRSDHGAPEYEIRHLPDSQIEAADHLSRLHISDSVDDKHRQEIEDEVRSSLSFYYGICGDDRAYVMMFGQSDRVRLAYSPNGGGKSPSWSPAWDYVLHLDDAQLDEAYTWDVRLALLPFGGRAEILKEVEKYKAGF
jgi:hypothetical protein